MSRENEGKPSHRVSFYGNKHVSDVTVKQHWEWCELTEVEVSYTLLSLSFSSVRTGIIHFLPVIMFPMLFFPHSFINFLKEWNVYFLPAFGIS